ncbi:Glycerate kinase [Planococcus halocryophilus Or1]|uniref:Glycerate kinase n=1 Tax=Planococcus halocryophilus TaxID=1215089 RepID=A0A1C7DVP6_9BACL|nr:glycerate kinase [Planococcus halocryophilus]ANU15293.1 glycerate kinase [Planococcus halocryophilus]EMF47647.1 Glycerate kinase [Planococcus halocryophilus Or1]
MKIIAAPDSFKGSLSAMKAAQAMAEGIQQLDREVEMVLLPAADGGEGTMIAMVEATGGELVPHEVEDPLGRKVIASYGILGDGKTCVIEIAEASGLTLLKEHEQDPLSASSFGTGELISRALDAGFRTFIIGLGGSATNDGGAGMLEALGMNFLDQAGQRLPRGGGALGRLAELDVSGFDHRISESTFLIACDVENTLLGEQGASAVFGPQKGASLEMVQQLDVNLKNFADVVERLTGIALHHKNGAGAAGGAGGAMQAFFAGDMQRGVDVVLEAIAFRYQIDTVDLIITGEGKSDHQTLSGKTPFGIAEVGKEAGKPVILISGMVEPASLNLLVPYFTEIHSIVGEQVSKDRAIADAYNQLKIKTQTVVKAYLEKQKGC